MLGRRPRATDMGWKRVGQRRWELGWTMYCVAMALVFLSLGFLMVNLCVIGPSIGEHLGTVTVNRVIGSASDRHAGGTTWTLTFVEKSTTMEIVNQTEPTYNVIYNGGTVQPGQRFELCRRRDGHHVLRMPTR